MPAPSAVAELVDDVDRRMLQRVYELAIQAERSGNLPIACVIAREGQVASEGENRTLSPWIGPVLPDLFVPLCDRALGRRS